jgi:hypothetical protein
VSSWWKDIRGIRREERSLLTNWFNNQLSKEFGDGRHTYFRFDPLLEGKRLCDCFGRLFSLFNNKPVLVVNMCNRDGWWELSPKQLGLFVKSVQAF